LIHGNDDEKHIRVSSSQCSLRIYMYFATTNDEVRLCQVVNAENLRINVVLI